MGTRATRSRIQWARTGIGQGRAAGQGRAGQVRAGQDKTGPKREISKVIAAEQEARGDSQTKQQDRQHTMRGFLQVLKRDDLEGRAVRYRSWRACPATPASPACLPSSTTCSWCQNGGFGLVLIIMQNMIKNADQPLMSQVLGLAL